MFGVCELRGVCSEGREIVEEQERGRGMCEGLGDEIVVCTQEGDAVEGGSGEVVGYFAAELAGEHRVQVCVGWFGEAGLRGHSCSFFLDRVWLPRDCRFIRGGGSWRRGSSLLELGVGLEDGGVRLRYNVGFRIAQHPSP